MNCDDITSSPCEGQEKSQDVFFDSEQLATKGAISVSDSSYSYPLPPPPPPLPVHGIRTNLKPYSIEANRVNKSEESNYNSNNNVINLPTTANFKDELIAKHLKLNTASILKNKQSSSDESMKVKNISPTNQITTTIRSASACNNNSDQMYSHINFPAKLYTSLGREDKKPFAYTAEVNDPNNRGKLDLSQIKSPAMKRRLLANMASSEDEREDNEANSHDAIDENPTSPRLIKHLQHHDKPRIVSHNNPNWQQQYMNNNNNSAKSTGCYVTNDTHRQKQQQWNNHKPTEVIKYNEPIKFYNTNTNPVQIPVSDNEIRRQKPISRYENDLYLNSMDNGYINELGFEVEKSLESFEQLVSNMGSSSCGPETTSSTTALSSFNKYKPTIRYHEPNRKLSSMTSSRIGNNQHDNFDIPIRTQQYNESLLDEYVLTPQNHHHYFTYGQTQPQHIPMTPTSSFSKQPYY